MKSTALIFGFLLASCLVSGQQNTQRMAVHEYPNDHLSISVPASWMAIPRSDLDQISAGLRQVAPNAKPQPYNHGFQATSRSSYPRVLIQVKKTGRWDEKIFSQMPQLPEMKKGVQKQVGSASRAFAAMNLQLEKLTYDPSRRLVWLRMQLTMEGGQKVQVLSGLLPTSVGSIQVHCYAPAVDFEKYAAAFTEIITSAQVGGEWKYVAKNRSAEPVSGAGN